MTRTLNLVVRLLESHVYALMAPGYGVATLTVFISDKPHPNETTVLRRIHKTFYTPLRHLTKPWGTGDHLQVHPQVLLLWHCCKGESLVHTIVGEGFPRHRRMRL